jgi:hypothetical protein
VHRQTSENFQEVIGVESFIETAYKGFIDALLLSPSSWSSIVVHEVRYNVYQEPAQNFFREDCEETC